MSCALLRSPPCPAHLAEEENLREDGRHVCSSEHPAAPPPPPPRPVQMRRSRGPRGQKGCGPWGAAATLRGSHGCGAVAGAASPWTQRRCFQAGLKRHLSPELSSQLFLFLPSLTVCSRGWDPGSHPESESTVWLQLGLISLFSQSLPEMEFTSHLGSVHKLFFFEILFYCFFFIYLDFI